MDDLLQDFVAETTEMLEAISGELVAWEADPGDRARLDAIFRFVHTVKGSCGFLDLPRLARLSHAAEDGLQAARNGARAPDRAFVDATLAIIDRIGALTDAIAQGRALDDGADDTLIAALANVGQPAARPLPTSSVRRAPPRSVRLSVELLDGMMSRMSDLVLARNELARRLRGDGGAPEADAALERLSATVADLRDSVTRMRMQRLDTLFGALPRTARDIAAELGKAVTLVIEGGDVELDREMIEMIRDPLIHIVRNAVDHGIEAPAVRQAAGKPAAGCIRIGARQAGNQIEIIVADDGAGLDTAALTARVVADGTLTEAQAARLSEAERRALVFRPGISTATEVSQLSGRGVGMDVVRANVERIGGSVLLDGAAGAGLRVAIRVPLTLSIIPAISVLCAGMRFAVPRAAIEEIVGVSAVATPSRAGDAEVLRLRGRTLPQLGLAGLLGLDAAVPAVHIVLGLGSGSFALGVDAVGDSEELVIKPAAPLVMASGCFAGQTLPDNGVPMLVLDPAGLAARAGIAFPHRDRPAPIEAVSPAAEAQLRVLLFRGLDGACGALPVAALDRVLGADVDDIADAGGQAVLVLDGAVLPIVGALPAPGRAVELLRLWDGTRAIGLVVEAALDIVDVAAVLAPSDDPACLGLAIVDGVAVAVVDPCALFALAPAQVRAAGRCRLLADADGWMAGMLKPLLEAAGYCAEIVDADDGGADVLIALDRDASVTLRREQAPRAPEDGSIYRYDRAAVIAAIARASERAA